MGLRGLLLLVLAAASTAAGAQQVIVSPAPDSVTVTVYRDPHRPSDERRESYELPGGYALITEVRTVELPAGSATVRFEGVASGIQPETAIMRGLDPREKNQDRLLLSKRGLLDAYTGQSVLVRRTNRATGKVTIERGRIRSGPDGVVLETAAGFESLDCDGTIRALLYPKVPVGLSAKPVLSMTTTGQTAGPMRIELSYLTQNMDWDADYVAELSEDASRADLFAWLTIASRDDTTFADAETLAVAGEVARAENDEDQDYSSSDDELDWDEDPTDSKCWPAGVTAENVLSVPVTVVGQDELQLRQSNVAESVMAPEGDIVVTGSMVRQEEIGDLKLYRIPFRVTVASRSQKQAAFLDRKGVPGQLVYRSMVRYSPGDPEQVFRMRNLTREGLGVPLPGGAVTVFQRVDGRRLLRNEARLGNRAVGEDVELRMNESTMVSIDTDEIASGDGWTRTKLVVSNANPYPIRYEAEFETGPRLRYDQFSRRTSLRKGKTVWAATVPANGKAELKYRRVEIDADVDD